jgi:glycosyltransferase involved in cell wall biosynthesis
MNFKSKNDKVPTVSIITACKNRIDSLKVSLSSWLTFDEIKEVIIVDWNSDEPINHLTQIDPRVKVIRVNDKKYFNQPQPLNLAASLAAGDYIMKMDSDHVINPYFNFVNDILPREKEFFCGQLEYNSNDQRQTILTFNGFYRYLVGILLLKREYFLSVGGYNEKLGDCYAYEDEEMYQRLELFGLKKNKVKISSYNFIHLPHGDSKRTENFKGFAEQDEYLQQIYDKLKHEHDGDELKWQIDYGLSEHHTKLNKELVGKVTDYKNVNATEWEVKKISEQFFEAHEKKKGTTEIKLPLVRFVSLEESNDRRETLLKSLRVYGIDSKCYISKRFHECEYNVTGTFAHTLNEGTKGCAISHLQMIKDWYDSTDDDYGFFAEDDLSLETLQYWTSTWDEFVENTPEDADCIQLLTIRNEISSLQLREREWNDWGATAYIITRNHAKKIIDAYIKENSYHLEIPGSSTQPLVENLIYTIGKTYTAPMFVENIDFISTFENRDNDVNDGGKNDHKRASKLVLDLWKNISPSKLKKESLNIKPEKTELEELITKYSLNPEDPENNFNLGYYYYQKGHTAPALSYFLRCAELGKESNPNLAYTGLIMGSYCYFKQGTRDHSGRGMLWQAQMFLPERPEAHFLLARYAEKNQWWQDCYSSCTLALHICDFYLEPLPVTVEYPGKWGFFYEKALASWWWGKTKQAHKLFKRVLLKHKDELSKDEWNVVVTNLKKINGDPENVYSLL